MPNKKSQSKPYPMSDALVKTKHKIPVSNITFYCLI